MIAIRSRPVMWFTAGLVLALAMLWTSTVWRAEALPSLEESTTVSVTPERILDTRDPTNVGLAGPFVSPNAQKLQVTGSVPTTTGTKVVVPAGATGVVLNVTSINSTADGFISVRPGDATGAPATSSLNFTAGTIIPNSVQVSMPTTGPNAGQIDITYDAFGTPGPTTDILIDVVAYTTNTGLQEINAALATKVPGELFAPSPVRVTATEAVSLAAARAAAPETSLFTRGTITVYAKCMYDTTANSIYGEMYVRTTADGAMMEGNDDLPGTGTGMVFLNIATLEEDRQLDTQTAGVANTASFNESEGAITAADGKAYSVLPNIGVKQGSPAGGNGPFGAGNVCLFGGAILG